MSCVFVALEGVLGQEGMGGFQPVPEAIRFLSALRRNYKVILSSTSSDVGKMEHWLMLNGLNRELFFEELVCSSYTELSATAVRTIQLQEYRGRGYDISLVITSEPDFIATAVSAGIQSLLWASPSYLRPEMMPGGARAPKAWDVIEEEIVHQRELKAKDPRRFVSGVD